MDLLNNSFFRFYKLFFYSDIFKMEVDFIDKSVIDKKHLSKAREISNAMNAFKLNIKREFSRKGIKYEEVFQDCSNEKIYSIMSVVNCMLILSEKQCLAFEQSIELSEEKPIN